MGTLLRLADYQPIPNTPNQNGNFAVLTIEDINAKLEPFLDKADFSQKTIDNLLDDIITIYGEGGLDTFMIIILNESDLDNKVKSDIFLQSHYHYDKNSTEMSNSLLLAMHLANKSKDDGYIKGKIQKIKNIATSNKEELNTLGKILLESNYITKYELLTIINQLATTSVKPTLQIVPVQISLLLDK